MGNPDGYKNLFDVLEEQGKGEEAVNQLEIGASKKSLDCIEWLSLMLYYGNKVAEYQVEENTDKAYHLLTSVSWDDQHTIAMETLGNIYWDLEDATNAKKYYEKALTVNAENYSAIFHLGQLLRSEKDIIDYPRAKELLTIAADNGYIMAMNDLGVMFYLGEGCEQNELAALDWLRKAAQEGNHQSMINLYDILSDENPEEALYWLNLAADGGSEEAQNRLQEIENEKDFDYNEGNFDYENDSCEEIRQKVTEIIVDKLGVPEEDVTSYALLATDLGVDSLDAAELIMEMEKEFDMEIPDKVAAKIRTVGDIITYIQMHK